ncbi:hypothetical protein VTI28DRAFT_9598 [Corynascus sepedonium]
MNDAPFVDAIKTSGASRSLGRLGSACHSDEPTIKRGGHSGNKNGAPTQYWRLMMVNGCGLLGGPDGSKLPGLLLAAWS